MKTVYHAAQSRGHADHGWLNSYHTFSFAHYYDPERVHFGALRVLNDDAVSPGMGFGTHPHDNMEIVSIPLAGALEHKDSMGNGSVIRTGDVQVMSAGTGITHSEFNHSKQEQVKFLQIWVFPNERNVTPRYDQKTFDFAQQTGQWQTLVSPLQDGSMTIHQDAYFRMAQLTEGQQLDYTLSKAGYGVYFFVIEGTAKVGEQALATRDGLGVYDTDKVTVQATSAARVLAIEVPMNN